MPPHGAGSDRRATGPREPAPRALPAPEAARGSGSIPGLDAVTNHRILGSVSMVHEFAPSAAAVPAAAPGIRARRKMARAAFAMATGIFAATSAFASACKDALPLGASAAAGTLTVQVLGLGSSPAPADGGSVTVTASGASGNVTFPGTLPATGVASGDVPPGSYTVSYIPPGGYLLAGGETATKTVDVASGQPITVSFNVVATQAPTGTLRVTVTGLAPGAASGGSAAVLRTDTAGQSTQTQAVPRGGSLSLAVVAGTYRVTYTAPSGYTISGASQVSGLVVGSGGTATAGFAVLAVVANGTLQVNVSGLTGSPSNGGTAVAQRTDASGSAITINISAAGSGSSSTVPAGTYTVNYTPPAGFSVTGTDPVTGVVVSQGATATVSFTVAVATAGAPDIYGFGFEDRTGGQLRDPSGNSMFAGAWKIDSSTAYRGRYSVSQVYTPTGANTGDAFVFTLPASRRAIYVQFAFRQSNPFNNDGVNNSDQMKVFRLHGPGVTGNLASFFISNSKDASPGVPLVSFSDLEGGIQHAPNKGTWDANAHLGEWHLYQFYFDISTSGALVERGWIDGVLMWDYTINASNGGQTFGVVSWSDVINSMASTSTAWYDDIGISTQPIAAP